MATNGSFANQDQYKSSVDQSAATSAPADAGSSGNNLSKDEVGWYFVEQYYTTLSKSPEKLHLFYGKQSQFVSGLEAEVANVSVGRQPIQERIKQLDFQDCKVRVSNVDSQASFDNIVIQVIGEISNKSGEPKKFVQTFVLAQQPSGYFVLNDILRYISEDQEEQPAEAELEAPAAEPEVTAAEVPAAAEPEPVEKEEKAEETVNADEVDQKLQEASEVNGTDVEEPAVPAETTEAEPEKPAPVDPETAAKEAAEEEAKVLAELPKEPTPTPAMKPVPQPEAAPAEPAAPPKPMTWASRAAAAAGPRPVVPLPKTATPPAAGQNRAPAPTTASAAAQPSAAAAAPAAASTPATSAPAAPAAPAADAQAKEATGWQTAGADSKRQNRPQSMSVNAGEKEGTMGYVKYVTDKVQDADLRTALAAFGELTYFDINRAKNCAFVEYKTVEGYQAALANKNLTVNGENIVVEPRRPKSNAYGGNFGAGRGNASGRGRGGAGGQNPRGNFTGQVRGRGGAARGRGGAQVANA
ncbi:hypothetical protein HDV57DRAFT_413032 [Trichoderma longibrachiatum]|uniref:NTF2-domain-containing protein n=1 Tax=Trichoderma longibrachiatum ATCC 18648 TaxID=983965 RepID=A0A2T4C2M2_TRILO|nr:hypothetical protein M440DRAFT_1334996 [Trichoderma longibrachiatum ATCC 18648]